MEVIKSSFDVIRVKKESKDPNKTGYVYYSGPHAKTTTILQQALHLNSGTVKDFVATYQKCALAFGDDNIECLKVSITATLEHIDMNQDLILEERRRVALEKLSNDDINALGLERLATYFKLKYTNASEEDDLVDLDSYL